MFRAVRPKHAKLDSIPAIIYPGECSVNRLPYGRLIVGMKSFNHVLII